MMLFPEVKPGLIQQIFPVYLVLDLLPGTEHRAENKEGLRGAYSNEEDAGQ